MRISISLVLKVCRVRVARRNGFCMPSRMKMNTFEKFWLAIVNFFRKLFGLPELGVEEVPGIKTDETPNTNADENPEADVEGVE